MPPKGHVTPNRAWYKPEEETVIIEMAGGKALIDAEDYVRVKGYRWLVQSGYVGTRLPDDSLIYLHRLVMNCEKHERVSFRTHDVWDCRKANLVVYEKKPPQPYGADRHERGGQLIPNRAKRAPFMDYVDPQTGEILMHGRGPKERVYERVRQSEDGLDEDPSTTLK